MFGGHNSAGIGAGLWGKKVQGHRKTSQRGWYPGCVSSELACSIQGERGENMPPYPIMHALFFPVNQASEKISSSKVKFNS